MLVDMRLFLQNVYAALANQQYQQATCLLQHAIKLAEQEGSVAVYPPFDVSMGLDRGRKRETNEDGVLAITGIVPGVHRFGLYVVCDGMGGHVHGQEAACLAIQTILDVVLSAMSSTTTHPHYERLLAESIQQANRAIYQRNYGVEQAPVTWDIPRPPRLHHMGTTVTAVLLVDETAYVANVGDSRTYLYDRALRRITQDHSLVARYRAEGLLQEEEIYTHPKRNQITRALGAQPLVKVDTFVVPLHGPEILLLCSDGLWEMTRDRTIEAVLAAPRASASAMATQLVQIAHDGGGTDNIGCIVVQVQRRADVGTMETTHVGPVPLKRLEVRSE